MLFYSGASHRMGEVDKGTTVTDFDPEEQERGITIYAACVTFPWRDCIDQPDRHARPRRFHGRSRTQPARARRRRGRVQRPRGVEAQSETVWRQADKYGVPRIAFINKMDREGADFRGHLQRNPRAAGIQSDRHSRFPSAAARPTCKMPFAA